MNTSAARVYLDGVKKKKPYAWLDLSTTPNLRWEDHTDLTHEERLKILGLLVKEQPDQFDPKVWQIYNALNQADRIAWSEAIESQWLNAGAKPAHKWAIFQLAALGAVARLAQRALELIELAVQGKHKRATWYVEAMSRLDSPLIRSWVFDLTINAPHGGTLQRSALDWHRSMLATSGLQPKVYLDTLNLYIREEHQEADIASVDFIPEKTTLSLGGTDYLVTFVDDGFELGLRHPDTRQLQRTFPAQSVKFDPTEWREAHDTFEALGQELEPFMSKWRQTFEHAMISARPYTYSYLKARFLRDRLMSHLIESLVWSTTEGKTVRLMEGACFDHEYDEVALPEEATLKLVHPLEIPHEIAQCWGNQLAEDEVIALFPQLDRDIYTLKSNPFTDLYADISVDKLDAFMALLKSQQWWHGPCDYGRYSSSYHLLPGRNARIWVDHAELSFQGSGFYYGGRVPSVSRVRFGALSGRNITKEKLDAVVYSEAYILIKKLADAAAVL